MYVKKLQLKTRQRENTKKMKSVCKYIENGKHKQINKLKLKSTKGKKGK
jgi:hypothetical protein